MADDRDNIVPLEERSLGFVLNDDEVLGAARGCLFALLFVLVCVGAALGLRWWLS